MPRVSRGAAPVIASPAMRVATLLAVTMVVLCTAELVAQPNAAHPPPESSSDPAPLFTVGTTEWMVVAGPAWGVSLFHSVGGYDYLLQTVSWGRILTAPKGPAALRGRFQWAFELVPIYAQYAPAHTYGVGFTPIVWRWNFEPRGRVWTFAEIAGGALWTRDPVPARTTTANFTAHGTYGVRYFFRPGQALIASYGLHHISNGNRLERNPGINAHTIQFGWTRMRPRS